MDSTDKRISREVASVDFEKLETEDQRYEIADSGNTSEITILILPGIEGAKAWKHQFRYFKSDFRTLVLSPEDRDLENYGEMVQKVLDHRNISGCILVGSNLSSFVISSLKDSKRVISTVFTDPRQSSIPFNKVSYRAMKAGTLNPKILKKIFFTEKADYRTARELNKDIDFMTWKEIESFKDSKIEGGAANALLINPEKSFFSQKGTREILEPDLSISNIGSGSFCFYEKPEEYNKAIFDFISKLKDFRKKIKVREKRESNKTLSEFEKNSQQRGKKVKKK